MRGGDWGYGPHPGNAAALTAQAPPDIVRGSIKIGTAFGIPIRIHWSFFVLLLVVGMVEGWFYLITLLFGSVLLHELGHSLVARRFGIRVLDITFWPLGGMARMSHIPESPKVEGLVAIAGPLVNFLIIGISVMGLLFGYLLIPGFTVFDGLGLAVLHVSGINFLLGAFNLLPAFPMDGGRLLRAWLARGRDWVSATEGAVKVGRIVALGMVVGPLVLAFALPSIGRGFLAMPFIALYIYFVGTQELMAVRLRHGQNPFGRFGIFAGRGPTRPREAEPEWSVYAPEKSPPPTSGPGHAQRPSSWEGDRPSGGFDEERVRELERYRGRIRRYSEEE